MDQATFRLNDAFVERYAKIAPPWGFGALSEIVYLRTYSRVKPDGNKEQWFETVRRVVEGCYRMQERHIKSQDLGWSNSRAQKSAQEMYDRMFWMKFLPPGRGIWAMGSPITEDKHLYSALNNCGFSSTERIDKDTTSPFTFMMDGSMLGIGIGFDTKGAGKISVVEPGTGGVGQVPKRYRKAYPYIHGPVADTDYQGNPVLWNYDVDEDGVFRIPDTREGWVVSLLYLLLAYLEGHPLPQFDFSLIRPEGLPIKTFGGITSGPGPLIEMHRLLSNKLQSKVGQIVDAELIADMMNMIGVCVVSGNLRRCLPAGSLVHTREGLVAIENIRPGMEARTSTGYARISELVKQGTQSLYGIRTQLGEFRCTARHQIAVMTGPGTYSWKQAQELVPGDRMVFVDSGIEGVSTHLPAWNYDRPENSTTCQDLTIPELDPELAWFFGYLHGNGYVRPNFEENGFNAQVSIAAPTEILKDRIEAQFLRFGIKPHVRAPQENDRCWRVTAQSKQLAWYMDQFKQAKTSIHVPNFILQGLRPIRAAYLAGLFDADGCGLNRPTILVASVYPDYLRQVQALYASLGIPSRHKLHRAPQGNWKALYHLRLVGERAITLFEEVIAPMSLKYVSTSRTRKSQNDYGFPSVWIKRSGLQLQGKWSPTSKQMTTATFDRLGGVRQGLTPVEVLEVVPNVATAETYDIAVPGPQEFVCGEGVLVHNTAQIMFGSPYSEAYLNLKNYRYNPKTGLYEGPRADRSAYGWTSNNSVFAELGMDYQRPAELTSVNGEPGYVWLENMRAFSRMGDPADWKDKKVAGSNPCSEQSLEHMELCCLVENFIDRHDDLEDFKRTLKFSYLYAKTVTLGKTHWPDTNRVMLRNRRIGSSLAGVVQFIDRHGLATLREWCEEGYQTITRYDRVYSDWFCIPESIKKTSIKPGGTVPKLPGSTSGGHWPEAVYMIRRVRLGKNDPLVPALRELGYRLEPAAEDPEGTLVVEVPTEVKDCQRDVTQVSMWEQLALAAFLQRHWADNQVSYTVKFNPETEGPQIEAALNYFQYQLKGISFLPLLEEGAYAQMPEEKITEAEFLKRRAEISDRPLMEVLAGQLQGPEAVGEKFCDGDTCVVPS